MHWRRELRFRLLACLAVQGRPVERDHLAFLFWPDQPDEVARRNLRKTWFGLRRLPALKAQGGLRAEGSLLAWEVDTDLAAWRAHCAAGAWREAVALAGAPLLEGLDGGSEEFQRWLELERAGAARQHREAVLALLPTLGPHEAALGLRCTQQLLALDPLDEAAMQAHVRLLAADGQLAAARRSHKQWREALHAELDVVAPDDLQAWLQAPSPDARPPAAQAGAPLYPTRFIGRRRELEELARWWDDPQAPRLLTLLGPPGSGKTRLATEALQVLGSGHPPRRFFVALDRLPAATTAEPGHPVFVRYLAEALGLHLAEGAQALERLATHLGAAPTLLVLDNLEHRPGDKPVLQRLLRLPGLRVLATSRLRLALEGERVLEISGLGADAMGLFEDRGGRALAPALREDAQRLCALLQGQPLAIELAARQCLHLSPDEVRQRVAADIDALAAASDELPPRQRSLRAAFETSWQLLPPALQQALARLAVLRADFSRGAAQDIADVGHAALSALVDHSLLQVDLARGRLGWHPFVREFAMSKLAADPVTRAATERRHAEYFVHRLRLLDLREEHPTPAALREAALECENLVDAWRHAVALGRHELWESLAEALALHFEIHARFREGAALLALSEAQPDPASHRAAARVTVLRARLLHWADNDGAEALAQRALQAFEQTGDDAGRIAAWRVLAVLDWRRGRIDPAIVLFQRALALCQRSGHDGKRAMLLDGLGLALIHRGDAQGSRAAFEQALALNEARGNSLQRVHNLINLALDARTRTPPQAMALARRALALAQDIGFDHYVPHALATMSMAHTAAGDADSGREFAHRAVELTRRSGDTYIESWALTALARSCLAAGQKGPAAQALSLGLELSWQTQDLGLVSQHLALAAEWLAQAGRQVVAGGIVQALLMQPVVPSWQRLALEALQARLPPRESGEGPHSLAACVHVALGELGTPGGPPTL